MKTIYTDNEIKEKLKTLLPPKRYKHTLGVCETALELATIYGVDTKKAYLAALLHDCAKYLSIEEQIQKCRELGIILDNESLLCAPVIHAPLGAQLAREVYGIEDEEVLNAIKYHTIAREGMSKLEKIIYISDMTEPTRDYDEVDMLREISKTDLDKAMVKCIGECIIFNIKKGKTIHQNSIKCYNELICKEAK